MKAIIVADKCEVHKIKYKLIEKKSINQFIFYIFNIEDKHVVFVNSKIGIANASACTQSLIENFPISKIYNYGTVGSIPNSKLKIFDLVYPNKIFYHDVITPWYERGETPGEKKYYDNKLQIKSNDNLASGSSFVNDINYAKNIYKKQNVTIFDMETAAIAQICDQNKIKFYVIKCVSDIIGNIINIEIINNNIKKASKKAFNKIIEIIINH